MSKIIQVDTTDLRTGMYVCGLDRPWLEVPFPVQGFLIESVQDIARIQKYCRYVSIDTTQGSVQAGTIKRRSPSEPHRSNQQIFPGRRLKVYEDSTTWAEELPRAGAAVNALMETVEPIFWRVAIGGVLDVVKIKQSVDPLIDSIARNPDACIWLARVKQQDPYCRQHPVGASIWAVALGRQIGLPRPDLRSLAIGGLLFDIGKQRTNPELLDATRTLTDEEFAEVRSHVALGVDVVRDSSLMNTDVLHMVAYHHERHDGSGYPNGLGGDEIPIHARIAAIVDCYDAITRPRSYARAVSPAAAIKQLYQWRDREFQAELIENFIQAVGIYPAGSLVELSSGEVAAVVAEYRTRRLRPKIMVLLDADKRPCEEVKIMDMSGRVVTPDGNPLKITGSLEPGAYGIDMAAIKL